MNRLVLYLHEPIDIDVGNQIVHAMAGRARNERAPAGLRLIGYPIKPIR